MELGGADGHDAPWSHGSVVARVTHLEFCTYPPVGGPAPGGECKTYARYVAWWGAGDSYGKQVSSRTLSHFKMSCLDGPIRSESRGEMRVSE